jgi:phenylacetate-CoA ligase
MAGQQFGNGNMLRQTYYYLRMKNNPWMGEDALRRLQLRKLKHLIQHAYETTGFYNDFYDDFQVGPQIIKSLADLPRLPLINKEIVNRAGQDIISNKYSAASLIKKKTSGTTGVAVTIYLTQACADLTGAAKFRIDVMNGFRPRFTTAHWYLRGIKKEKKFAHILGLNRQLMISPNTPMEEQVALLQKQQPEAFYSYPSQLVRVARYILENDIKGIHPNVIILHSENSQRREREIIQNCFGVNPVDVYGAREFGTIAWGGGKSNCQGLHINADLLLLEVVDPDTGQRVGEGESGNIVITDFANLAGPLIRYDTRDVGLATYHQCECGMSFPVIKEVLGRTGQTVKLPSGEEHTLNFGIHLLILPFDAVEQYQVIITNQNSLIVKIKTTGNVKINDSELSATISERCGGIQSEIQYVVSSDEFITAPSGKFLDIVRESDLSRS